MPQFGITIFPTDYSIQPIELAKALEERGFDSVFFPEHTHIPANRRTPFPGGGDLPKHYWHTHDPFVALTACAAVTQKLLLGTGICLVIERDPITTAKVIASLDVISRGRVILGIGAGWNREEMENHGAPFAPRWKVVREKILAMKAIWRDDEAAYHGEFVNFDPLWSYPKPHTRQGPPIWIGANSPWVFDRIAEYADGWMPIGGAGSGNMQRLSDACDKRGRALKDITLALFAAPEDEKQLANRIDQGFTHMVFSVPSETADKVLPRLDRLAKIAAKFR